MASRTPPTQSPAQPPAQPPHDAALIQQAALGDWLLAWPVLRALAGQSPTLAVTQSSKARLAQDCLPGILAFPIESPTWTLLHAPPPLPEPALRLSPKPHPLAACRLVVSFVSDGRDPWARNAQALAPQARLAFLTTRPPENWDRHLHLWHALRLREQGLPQLTALVEQFHHQPSASPLPPDSLGPQPSPKPVMNQPVSAYPAGTDSAAREPANTHAAAPTDVLAHPGAGAPSKCWPADRWQQLLETLENRGRHVRILIGETELDRWPPATLDRWRRRWPLIAPPDARALAHAIAPHQLFIGHDTGPTHLAAALGLPTLALFGPTPALWWRPVGPHVLALHPPSPTPMDWLHVPHVLDAIDRLAQPPNHGLSPKPTPAA